MDNNEILINKYRRSDLIIKRDYVIFIGRDELSHTVRIESRNRREFVHKSQIADYGDYLYIPADKSPKSEDGYRFPSPIKSAYLTKYQWKFIKNSHPLSCDEKEV